LCAALPRIASLVSITGSAALAAAAVPICIDAFAGDAIEYSLWYMDGLSALFTILICSVAMTASLYSRSYLRKEAEEETITRKDERLYYTMFHLFVAAMLSTCVVNSMGILWISIEATTLVSAFLVGLYRKKSSMEAAWKYLMICSVGITLALMGITLVYASSVDVLGDDPAALNWTVLYSVAPSLDPDLMRMAFILILIGFGTKMGLVPMHTWLPDAHSQAPTPVSAMLSAVLLNCALYAIIRFQMIVNVTIPGFTVYPMICFGLLSMGVAAAFILISKNLKRMLAYSSIEHMGIILIGFGICAPLAVFGALFHIAAHSLTKAFVFFSAGNIIQEYGTTDIEEIRGVRGRMPFTAFMFTAGSLAIAGMPPFAVFTGELSIIAGSAESGMYARAAVTIILIVIVFAGFAKSTFGMMSGVNERSERISITRAIPLISLFAAMLFLGLFMPDGLKDVLESISSEIAGAMR